jgi:hypothetical protein
MSAVVGVKVDVDVGGAVVIGGIVVVVLVELAGVTAVTVEVEVLEDAA